MAHEPLYILAARVEVQLEQPRFEAILANLPGFIREELLGYKRWQDAQASLSGKLLLERLLQQLELPYGLADIRLGHKDRPFIDTGFDFNISHSGNWVAVALARNNQVGIDIEKHRPINPSLFRKYFTETEWAQLDPADPLPAFFRLWAIKEAAIKCDGRGVEVLGKTTILSENSVQCDEATFCYERIEIGDGYSGAWCAKYPVSGIKLQTIELFTA